MSVRGILGAAAVAALVAVAGCGSAAGKGEPAGAASGRPSGTVTVFAAASLTEAFGTIARQFEAANPGTTVSLNFAGSSALATQINQGAPADVFASAGGATMRTVTQGGNAAGPARSFARNQLVIAVPDGNPRGVRGLADLVRPDTKVALCAEQVPCGAAARTALAAGRVDLTPVTLEQDVKAALSKLTLGEVDAALVYRTDARSSAVDAVEFPESKQALNDYPIVALTEAPNPVGARAFVEYVLSDPGRAVLSEAGFQAP